MGRCIVPLVALCCACTVIVDVGGECSRTDPRCGAPAPGLEVRPMQPAPPPPPPPPLRVSIQYGGAERQEIVLSCVDPCATLTAAVEGGIAPYTYDWSDGGRDSTRRDCPSVPTTYSVTVHDSSADSAGSPAPQAASAAMTLRPTPCPAPTPPLEPDAGTPPSPLGDQPDAGTLANCTTVAFDRRRVPVTSSCAAPAWMTLERRISGGRLHELRAYGRGLFVGRWRIELWGSSDGCTRIERLGEFSVAAMEVDTRIPFAPLHDHAMILLNVVEEADSERWVPYLGYSICD